MQAIQTVGLGKRYKNVAAVDSLFLMRVVLWIF